MAARHKASFEKILQSALKHRAAGSRLAESVASIEAMILTGIMGTSVVSKDKPSILLVQRDVSHKASGTRIQNAMETLQSIISAETLTLVAGDISVSSQSKTTMKAILVSTAASRVLGKKLADMCDLQDKALDALIAAYPPGAIQTALLAIKNA